MNLFDLEILTELSNQEGAVLVGGQLLDVSTAAAGTGGDGTIYTTDACEILTTVEGVPTIKWDWSNEYCVHKALNGSPNSPVS